MSRKYKHEDKVPSEALCTRLDQLSTAVTKGRESILREFVMRIPAEMDHDADIVLSLASQRIAALEQQVAELQEAQRWVPVSERLPEEGAGRRSMGVLVFCPKNNSVYAACYHFEVMKWVIFMGYEYLCYPVTLWTPLLTPPQEPHHE